ncbi:hypothetical protein SLEP1_g42148 [Rubroshorea leprosula]|uniref:Disease resistance protein At4g27190-like leucine-rich repeats domain-containing protein n=1 Tax=Rubroshorea leprosula TaxID=152421 RepID=A0AAV5LA85_9ROSI|nr:hypothetical protein SLEP1_g42148 [Rubroshorea leprosula]
MPELKVLDLSRTSIQALPNSITNLENLFALRLEWCERLRYLPSLAKLRALKKLDLHCTGIDVVPQGVEKLISLEYLDLYNCKSLKEISMGMLSNLSHLQYLVVDTKLKITLNKDERLSKLETFHGVLNDIQGFNYFVKSQDFQIFINYRIAVGAAMYKFIRDQKKLVVLIYNDIGGECILLPDNIEDLCIYALLGKLEDLSLRKLPNLSVLVRVEGGATPRHVFSNLKSLYTAECSRMRKLLPLELLQALQNIEKIEVYCCEQMEEIIASSDSDASPDKFTFPKLKELKLSFLPQLKSICSAKGVVDFNFSIPILAQSVGNWRKESQDPVSDELQVLLNPFFCVDDGEAIEEGDTDDDANGVDFKIASNGERQQEKERGKSTNIHAL